MQEFLVAIDGGTSNTRLRLLQNGKIIDVYKIPVGASAVGENGVNSKLETELKKAIDLIESKHNCSISCFLGSGMITSNIGLISIPHLCAPFKPCKDSFVTVHFEQIHTAPFYFVPGIKFVDDSENLYFHDLAKGEEVEVYGILNESDYDKDILILHYGTHNKAIQVVNGEIIQSLTTISGELLTAIINNTIIKNSVSNFNDLVLSEEHVIQGFDYAKKLGLSRSLFLGRVGDIVKHLSKDEIFSFVYGALVQADFQAFDDVLNKKYHRFIAYGQEHYARAFSICLKHTNNINYSNLEMISHEESELLSTKGIYKIYQLSKGE